MADALVIGAGPAGLMAAEVMARAGMRVEIAEQKPSVARKFLMAGKSGLNLTKDEPTSAALRAYSPCPPMLRAAVEAFGPPEVMDWARGLGQPLFTGSSGRVFPQAMKASPLMRAWLDRLDRSGAMIHTRWRWTGWQGAEWRFETPQGPVRRHPDRVVLALGGASWPRLGSDADWVPWLRARGVIVTPFAAANAGLHVDWTDHMTRHFGQALKAVAWQAGGIVSRGEAVISARGLEGGGIYPVIPAVRARSPLTVDLIPDISPDRLTARLAGAPRTGLSRILRNTLRLPPEKIALFHEFSGAQNTKVGSADLARLLKTLPVRHEGPRPIAEAISSAGGIAWESVGPGFALTDVPGVHVAGEMLDWEAPTGGYLLTACLATGRAAGLAAIEGAAG